MVAVHDIIEISTACEQGRHGNCDQVPGSVCLCPCHVSAINAMPISARIILGFPEAA